MTIGYGKMLSLNYLYMKSSHQLFLGDFSPKSPAGRSIFVVWALLGVATMTILISGMLYDA